MATGIFCKALKGQIVGNPFPKKCHCGCRFYSRQEYLHGTDPNKRKPLFDYKVNEKFVVKEFRDCQRCGFTMMVRIKDRRDQSAAGDRRREWYRELYADFIQKGLSHFEARNETLEIVRASMENLPTAG